MQFATYVNAYFWHKFEFHGWMEVFLQDRWICTLHRRTIWKSTQAYQVRTGIKLPLPLSICVWEVSRHHLRKVNHRLPSKQFAFFHRLHKDDEQRTATSFASSLSLVTGRSVFMLLLYCEAWYSHSLYECGNCVNSRRSKHGDPGRSGNLRQWDSICDSFDTTCGCDIGSSLKIKE